MFGENSVLSGAALLNHGNSNVLGMKGIRKHGNASSIRGRGSVRGKCRLGHAQARMPLPRGRHPRQAKGALAKPQ
eukprot:6526343-Prorocentrum_lima.AAC.1